MLQHVALEVRAADADAEVAFWALLGFVEVPPPAGLVGASRWVERERTQVHLLLTDDPVAPPRGHAAVHTPQYAETLARVAAAGFTPDPRPEHWGASRAFLSSPAGHRVEVMAAPPA